MSRVNGLVAAEAEARDEAIAAAQLATHTWLPAVQKKALLPTPDHPDTLNYLCRVIADADRPANNGVWEWIAGSDEWTYFSDNQDWVDENELDAEIDALPDGSTVELNADGKLAVKNGGIATAKIEDGAVTAAKIADGVLGPSQFTYVVDSNAALAAWANNTAGNNYTSVLIKPGTWSSSKEVNLTTSRTKVVVGMPESKLSFTSQYGLRYTSLVSGIESSMERVSVQMTSTGVCYGFSNCNNLTNCEAVLTSTNNIDSAGYSNCTNIINCQVAIKTVSGVGFCNCKGLLFNKPISGNRTTVYTDCYVLVNGTGALPMPNAEGGWNSTAAGA
jgi:hypothetical protein